MYSTGVNLKLGLDRFLGLQEVEAPRIYRQPAHEGVKLSALGTGCLYLREIILLCNCVRR